MTEGLRKLLAADEVEKLSGIKQNGPAFHIYPGAVHTRLSHSIGVYHLGREILLSLSRKNEELPFSEKGIMSFLSACLLHDIGHFPYAHSLKELAIKEHEEIAAELILGNDELGKAIDFDARTAIPFEGERHNALDDARYQAKYVSAIWQKLIPSQADF